MLNIRDEMMFVPLSTPVRCSHKKSQFAMPYARLLKALERELNQLRARRIVLEADFAAKDIRNDGWPRSSATVSSPGVRLGFETPDGPLRFECGTYAKWEDNLRAICLTMESLRAVERYGAVKSGQQYAGFKALPAGGEQAAKSAEFKTAMQAAEYIANLLGVREDDVLDYPRDAIRDAQRKTHPDTGGSAEEFSRVQAAKAVLL